MGMTPSITVDDDLGRELGAVPGEDCTAAVARAIRKYLDRRAIAVVAAWHASLDGEDAAVLAEFDLAP
jgi:hypothetical protein